MFLRRKQGSLSFLDLQDIYNDVCATTIKNHDLESTGHLEEALRGWKSLHTTLLYKVDIYEKSNTRPSPEEAELLKELKSIRDENVKHLIRLLLELEDLSGPKKPTIQQHNTNSSASHKLSIPSLRSGSSLDRTLSGNGHQRSLQRTLRNNSYTKPSSNSDIVQAAASISWGLPKPSTRKSPESGLFADFDQTETPAVNWEKVSPADTMSSSSESSGSINLIDLDDSNYTYLHKRDDQTSSHGLRGSFEDLSLNRPISKAPPPPPPPPKNRTPMISVDSSRRIQPPSMAMPNMAKQPSANQYKAPPREQAASPKKYTYNKPKPMNVHEIMIKSKNKSDSRLSTAKVATKSSTAKALNTTTRSPPVSKSPSSISKKLNITYNYKPLEKSPALAGQKTTAVAKNKRAPKSEPKVNAAPHRESKMSDDCLSASEVVEEGEVIEQSDRSEEEQIALIKSIKGIDESAANQILNDIVVRGDPVYWDDVVGLESAKTSLKEAVVYPFLRPDLFRGLREPTRGMLLFGPPGTGKTMLARAVATESKSTFFSISSSSLTSKYLGESEKLVKALFLLARKLSPSIVFIDEIDSILGQRTEGEADSMRRIKNEFLVLWSELSSAAAGRDSSDDDVSRVLILGATNMPWAIDEAARRRFAKRVYIPLPERETRKKQITKLLEFQNHTLLEKDFEDLMDLTEGFSGSDITLLAKDSAMGPLRSLGDKLLSTPTEDIRPIQLEDFIESLKYVRPSVSKEGLGEYETWVTKFGSSGA